MGALDRVHDAVGGDGYAASLRTLSDDALMRRLDLLAARTRRGAGPFTPGPPDPRLAHLSDDDLLQRLDDLRKRLPDRGTIERGAAQAEHRSGLAPDALDGEV